MVQKCKVVSQQDIVMPQQANIMIDSTEYNDGITGHSMAQQHNIIQSRAFL